MTIQKLPDHIINKLKAGEIVERPSSILKELVENSLDANSTKIIINIKDGGKSMIQVEDNGDGIQLTDMDLLLERYATSKIKSEEDLYNIKSYGFRGEALASISEVSKITVSSKTKYSEIGTQMSKFGENVIIKHIPTGFNHGTIINIQDLFYNVPARLKFLKSPQTEFYYCYNYFVDIAIRHYNKNLIFKKNDKIIFNLESNLDIKKRIDEIFKKEYSYNIKENSIEKENIKIKCLVSDASLRFGSGENIRIYVNQRPIQDKIIRKAIMDSYNRQLTPGEYPLAIIIINIDPKEVDVNVHPKKNEVKFIDPRHIYNLVYSLITSTINANKISSHNINNIYNKQNNYNNTNKTSNDNIFLQKSFFQNMAIVEDKDIYINSIHDSQQNKIIENKTIGSFKIIGQIRDSYIIIQNETKIYYIDQHALAERISFEKMKKNIQNKKEKRQGLLLQPIKIIVPKIKDMELKIEEINNLGFDCSLISENTLIVYSVPEIFMQYKVDLEKIFNNILFLEENQVISLDYIIDGIFATKACKGSIKSGQKLSYEQMENLIKDGFEEIIGMFVCQHGRPFFIEIEKNKIDKLFDR